jgi:ATP-dependent protease ClpP protease subunit
VKLTPAPQRFAPDSRAEAPEGPWEIAIAGEFDEKAGDLIDKLVQVPFGSRGTIFFDSGGGSAYSGLALASIIRLRGLDADGVVAAECSSAALLPFAACRRRYVTSHASLFFHPMRWQSEEDVRLEEAAEWARHFKILEDDLDLLLSKMLGVSVERIVEWSRPGRFLTGTEIVEAGVATMLDLFGGSLREQLQRGAK